MTSNNFKTRLLRSVFNGILVIFLTISALTLALSLACGPDPRVKIYILVSEQTADSLSMSMRDRVEGELVFYT